MNLAMDCACALDRDEGGEEQRITPDFGGARRHGVGDVGSCGRSPVFTIYFTRAEAKSSGNKTSDNMDLYSIYSDLCS